MKIYRWWKYRTHQWWHDKLPLWIAYRMPRRLVMWCAVRVGANATTGEHRNQVVPDLTFMDALKRWGGETGAV
jgi:hypothetical protein